MRDDEPDGMLALSLAVAGRRWPHTDDARTWADRWIEAVGKNPAIATDRGTMIGWFANAIMAGHDVAMAKQATTTADSTASTEPGPAPPPPDDGEEKS